MSTYLSLYRLQPVQGEQGQIQQIDDAVAVVVAGEAGGGLKLIGAHVKKRQYTRPGIYCRWIIDIAVVCTQINEAIEINNAPTVDAG